VVSAQSRCEAARLCIEAGFSERRSCRLSKVSRHLIHYEHKQSQLDFKLTEKLKELTERYTRYGLRRIHQMLLREGFAVNIKRVHRLWKMLKLQIRRKIKRKRYQPKPEDMLQSSKPNQIWAMDFMFDSTAHGKTIKCLTIVDEHTREALGTVVHSHIKHRDVLRKLQELFIQRGKPEAIRTDNGSEFIAFGLRDWLVAQGVQSLYIPPGKPWRNGKNESFNSKLRDECLSREWFDSIIEARVVIKGFMKFYNQERIHSALGYLTPAEFARKENERLTFSVV
jgi:putative transposase